MRSHEDPWHAGRELVSRWLGLRPPQSRKRAATRTSVDSELLENDTLTVTAKSGWHVNVGAPWKWTGGDYDKASSTEDGGAKFKGASCGGTGKAYICNGHNGRGSCKGPVAFTVK